MTAPPYESAPATAEATSKFTHSQDSTSTAVPIPLQAINVEDIINATGYTNDAAEAPEAQLLADLEPCTCELTGRCASCERLPSVIRQRLLASQRQTTRTINSSPSSWESINGGSLNRQWQ